jgi:hypothetical protein
MFFIPVADYVDNPQLSFRERYRWALMDTFDMLAPYYDHPMSQPEAESVLRSEGITPRRLNNSGLNLVGEKAAVAEMAVR